MTDREQEAHLLTFPEGAVLSNEIGWTFVRKGYGLVWCGENPSREKVGYRYATLKGTTGFGYHQHPYTLQYNLNKPCWEDL